MKHETGVVRHGTETIEITHFWEVILSSVANTSGKGGGGVVVLLHARQSPKGIKVIKFRKYDFRRSTILK
jgi:hypothetical protein